MWSNRDWIYTPASYLKQPKTRHIKYVKRFLRHWASGNKGQQFLRDRDKWGESYERPTYCPERISRPQSRKGEPGWSPVDSLSFRNSWATRTNKCLELDKVPESGDPWRPTEGPSPVCSWRQINTCMGRNYPRWEKDYCPTPHRAESSAPRTWKQLL